MEALGSAAGRATSATRLVTSLAPEVISASRTDPMEAFATLFGEGPREWETMKGQIHSLASAATIATFLAAVQSQILSLSYQDNATKVKVATNALAFAGLLLDVSAAFLALLASTRLQRRVANIEKQLGAMQDASSEQIAEIVRHIGELSTSLMPPDIRRRLVAIVENRVVAIQKIREQGTHLDPLLPRGLTESTELSLASFSKSLSELPDVVSGGNAAGTAMTFGVYCFFGSVECLAISTQPAAVWIVSAILCAVIFVLPFMLGLFEKMGIRMGTIFDS
ncbi:hypothetical protein C8J57DRAFT_686759 [Mycena rebaudengoi]|nr:hypothetical protein C8J57DRAFT_686759 [Mycena rebaudengoi]